MAYEPLLEESTNPEQDLSSVLAAESPEPSPAPVAEDFQQPQTQQPNLAPMSDQDALDFATNLDEGPPAASAAPMATPQASGNPANVMGNYDAGVEQEAGARQNIDGLEAQQRSQAADALDQQAQLKRDQQVQKEMDQQADEDARAKVTGLVDSAQRDVENFKFVDHVKGTAGKKIQNMLAGFLAGLAGQGPQFLEGIQKRVDSDFNQQKDELTNKQNIVTMRKDGVKDFDQHIKEERAKIELRNASALEALGDEAKAQALRSGNPLAIAKAQQADAQFKQAAAIKRQDVQNKIYTGELEQSRAKALDARAAKLRAGAGGGSNTKLTALTAALTKSGGELTTEVAAVADGLHIKRADLTAMATQFKQERRVDKAERGEVGTSIAKWAQDNDYLPKAKKAKALEALSQVMTGGKANGLDKAIVLQEMEKAAKGGTATIGGVNIDMAHMAGGTDKLDQIISKIKTGDFSDAQTQNLIQSIQNQYAEAKAQIADAHDSFQQTFRNNSRLASDPKLSAEVDLGADQLFSGQGYSRKPKANGKADAKSDTGPPAKAPPAPMTLPDGTVYNFDPKTGKYHK